MTTDQEHAAAAEAAAVALASALEQSQDVQAKVEACADDLASANDAVKGKISEGVTTLPAAEALEDSQAVEAKVQECANDLHEVTETLAQGVDDLKLVETALTRSRQALAESEAALAMSRQEEHSARQRALHDGPTGLPNRALFDDRLAHAISLAERHHGWSLAVMFLDLDRFKSVNDTHGHAAGDVVLREVAARLLQHARDEDTVCRNGGDEFLYLLMNPKGRENVERIAGKILNSIAMPMDVNELQLELTLSIGIAIHPDHGATAEQLIRNADTAMYRAKKRGAGYVLFDPLEVNGASDEPEARSTSIASP